MAANLFSGKETREQKHRQALSREARFLVDQLGELKGSVVKDWASDGPVWRAFSPVEVTEALHTLEDRTVALDWPVIREVLVEQWAKPV